MRELKKNYAESLSRLLAQRCADALRPQFPGILPDEQGKGHESPARASKRTKKLDVNYSNPAIGLGLALSIKTLNFRDPKSQRYTKEFTRVDNEMARRGVRLSRTATLCRDDRLAVLPRDAVEGAKGKHHSSFAGAINVFRHRAGRRAPGDRTELFERLFIGLYDTNDARLGETSFFDVAEPPARSGVPRSLMTFSNVLSATRDEHDERNKVGITYEGEPDLAPTIEELQELQEDRKSDSDLAGNTTLWLVMLYARPVAEGE